jgi:hypothetical protein
LKLRRKVKYRAKKEIHYCLEENIMDENDNPGGRREPLYKKWWFWSIVVFLVIILYGALSGDNKDGKQNATGQDKRSPTLGAEEPKETDDSGNVKDTGSTNQTEGQRTEKSGKDNIAEEKSFREHSAAVLTTLNTGKFKVGTDIPEGRYRITGDGNGNLFIYDTNDVPYVNEILGGGDFGVESVTTDLRTGETIEISGMKKATFTPAETTLYKDALTTGNWIVGLDVPEGRYDIKSVGGGSGNLFIHNVTGWIEVNEILGGGEFGVDTVTVELKEGYSITIGGMNQVALVLIKTSSN